MENKFIPYPKQIKVGGQLIDINDVDRIGDGVLGECAIHRGTIEIARFVDRNDEPTESSKRNTFFHELTHAILGTMMTSSLYLRFHRFSPRRWLTLNSLTRSNGKEPTYH